MTAPVDQLRSDESTKGPRALLVNPMVYDTQYWPEWSLPSGLLKIGTFLRDRGYRTRLIDCLFTDARRQVRKTMRSVVELGSTSERAYQSVRSERRTLRPNEKYKYVFGQTLAEFRDALFQLGTVQPDLWSSSSDPFVPDEVYVTSIMTYWWESTVDVVRVVRQTYPSARIRVGGIYPTLAPEHLQRKLSEAGLDFELMLGREFESTLGNDGRDIIVMGEVPGASWADLDFGLYLDPRYYHGPGPSSSTYETAQQDPRNYTPPYSILTTTRGCPFDCAYCAQRAYNLGNTKVRRRATQDVLRELRDKAQKYGVREFAFYEDNFLFFPGHLQEILQGIIDDPFLKPTLQGRLHLSAPEGVEVRLAQMQLETIQLMRQAGFNRIYLPLENIHREVTAGQWNRKHSTVLHFEQAVKNCKEAGFSVGDMGINAFVLFGTPHEDIQCVIDTALYAADKVGSVIPMLFTPVPGSRLHREYEPYFAEMGYDLHHLNGKLLPMLELNRREKPELTASDYLELEAFLFRLNAQSVGGKPFAPSGDSNVAHAFRQFIVQRQRKITSLS